MTPFPAEIFRRKMPLFLSMSDDQMAPHIREKLRNVVSRPHTNRELYDVMAEVAATPVVCLSKGPPRVLMGDISGFVQAYCDVTEFYDRPTDDVVREPVSFEGVIDED